MCRIAPSLLEADYRYLDRELKTMKAAGAEYVHIDVMDGRFVPNLSFGMKMIQSIRTSSDLVFDVHMMVWEPERFAGRMKEAGADVLTVHYEACENVERTLQKIQSLKMKAGIALKPDTPVSVLTKEILETVDVIHLMTVEPGLEGQRFIEASLDRIRSVKEILEKAGLEREIEVDGNITGENLKSVVEAGATIIVSGKAIFQGSMEENIKKMRQIIKAA